MKLIKSYYKILSEIDPQKILKNIELAGRTCYKSENKITENSAKKFVKMILEKGHESVIEHEKVTVKVICDRGVSHEIVRHRIASYSQESTRYCNYASDKFNNHITFIIPCWFSEEAKSKILEDNIIEVEVIIGNFTENLWINHMLVCEKKYNSLIYEGWSPQEARSVLPNSLKTEIVITYNLREWRHFFKLRTSKAAHPQMREIICPMLDEFKKLIPIIFDNINYD